MPQKGKGSKQREKKEDAANRRGQRKSQGGKTLETNKPNTGIARRGYSADLRPG
jgi:hypothetical protein